MGGKAATERVASTPYGSIAITPSKLSYFPSEQIAGEITLQILKPFPGKTLYLYVEGREKTYFITTTHSNKKRRTHHHRGNHEIFNIKTPLAQQELAPGIYKFPYAFMMNRDFPPSFSFTANRCYALVQYYVLASYESEDKSITSDLDAAAEILIKPLLGDNQGDIQIAPVEMSISDKINACCGERGSCTINYSFGKSAFTVSEPIVLNLSVDNQQAKDDLKQLQCKLNRHITYVSNAGRSKSSLHTLVNEDIKYSVSAGNVGAMINISLKIPEYVVNNAEGGEGVMMCPTMDGELVGCQYVVYITPVYIEGTCVCCVSKPQVTFPVSIYPHQMQPTLYVQPTGAPDGEEDN